jgi:hypothetical protein
MPTGELLSDLGPQVAKVMENSPLLISESLKADYLRMSDPTEYRFANRCVPGGWTGWTALLNNPENEQVIGQWREELILKLRSEALLRILEAAAGDTRDALGANKYIYETLGPKEEKKVGRPTKEAILREASKLVDDQTKVDEAYERVLNAKEKI